MKARGTLHTGRRGPDVVGHLLGRLFATRLYQLTLGTRPPDTLRATPDDPWPGDPDIGGEVIGGTFPLPGGAATLEPLPWQGRPAADEALSPRRRAALHGFAWLRHLRAVATPNAASRARALVATWLDTYGTWSWPAWRGDVLGERLANWAANLDFLCVGADEAFRARLLTSLNAQSRHLGRIVGRSARDAGAFAAAKGLIWAGVVLPGGDERLKAGLIAMEDAITRQVLPDGGHFQRSPTVQLSVLADLSELRAVLDAAHVEVPTLLQGAIDRMAPVLRMLRHADGRLALFNGSTEGDAALTDQVLALSGSRSRPPESAPHTGFHRLRAGRTLVLADCGGAPPPGADLDAHAGLGAFEMSVGRQRVVVNCGAHPDESSEWHRALRLAAAHSAVTVDETGPVELPGTGRPPRPLDVSARRNEMDGSVLLEIAHDGFLARFDRRHTRDLYLASPGDDLRGRDVLSGKAGGVFAVRFHLHPDITASKVQDGSAVLLRLPGGSGWRFRASGGAISLRESIYAGEEGKRRRSEQIIVSGPLDSPEVVVKWAFRRERKDG